MRQDTNTFNTIAIVTGTSRGLGQALAQQLANQSTYLLSIARQAQVDEKTAQNAKQHGCHLHHISADLSDAKELATVGQQIHEWLTKSGQALALTAVQTAKHPIRFFLINNAGTLGPMAQFNGLAQDFESPAIITQTLTLNLSAPIYLSSVFLQTTQSYRELNADLNICVQVMNISSGAGRNAYPGWSVYCASKTALDRYSEVAQLEAPFAQIVSMAPGVIDTSMQAHIRSRCTQDFPSVQRFKDLHEQQALNRPHDVARQLLTYSLHPDFGSKTLDDIRLITLENHD